MAHRDWTIDDWKRVVWSDETKINRFNSDGRTWTWIRSGESLKSHHVKMTVKHGGGNIMLWSAITYAGVGWMCKINGNMDKTLYKEILEDELERTIEYGTNKLGLERHQVIFQHDSDPKHTVGQKTAARNCKIQALQLVVHGYCTKLSQTLTVCTSIESAFIRRLADMGNGYWWNLIMLKNAICI
ncbi:hypothetical protein G6F43_014000 [Rhizopus delemar]|nr:hypothetical protein G6F43_014000 [Rhizopus delemar]